MLLANHLHLCIFETLNYRALHEFVQQGNLVFLAQCCRKSIASLRRSDHINDTLASFHWLKSYEHVQYKLATVYCIDRSLNGTAPSYRPATVVWHAVQVTSAVIIDPSAGCPPVTWCNCWRPSLRHCWCSVVEHCLPTDIVACDTLLQFRRELKTFLFRQSYPDILL